MAIGEVLERLSVELALDVSEFATGSTAAQGQMRGLRDAAVRLGESWDNTARSLSRNVSLPIAGALGGVIAVASNFETSMRALSISTGGTADEMERMSALAVQLGSDTLFGASEAADAMDMLAKNGLTATEILEGAARAAVDLATATGSELSPAADAVTDVMQQFGLAVEELPQVVNQITGAVNESKLDFGDFALAIGQAGGVAGAAGVEFDDFAASLAATSSLFASGSDLGTSFKTFLQRLVPTSNAAATVMDELGLEFFDAQGNMKSMAEVAEQLRQGLGGLSEEAQNEALNTLFGSDASRTAIGLMNQGAEGIERVKALLEDTDAGAQAAERMKGFAGAVDNLGGAFESLAIAIANTGLLQAVTAMVSSFAGFITHLSETNPALLRFIGILALLAAAVGPIMLVMSSLAVVVLPLFLTKMGALATAISFVINPIGTLVTMFGGLLARLGAMTILRTLAGLFLRFAGPIGLIVTAGMLIHDNWDRIVALFNEVRTAMHEAIGPPLQRLITTLSAKFEEFWNGPLGQGIQAALVWLGDLRDAIWDALGDRMMDVLSAIGEVFMGLFRAIGLGIDFINALLNGDWAAAWGFAQDFVANIAITILSAIDELTGGALTAIVEMVHGIGHWLGSVLEGIWNSVTDKIDAVKGAFFDLFDAVVGNSYVPDMVDGIAAHMARLDAVMVQPATRAAGEVSRVMQDMARETRALLDRLFPEVRRMLDFQADAAAIDAAGLTDEQRREARFRLGVEAGGRGSEASPIDVFADRDLPQIEIDMERLGALVMETGQDVEDANLQIARSFKDMADQAIASLRGLMDGIRSGDFLSILEGVLGIGLQIAGLVTGKAAFAGSIPKFASGTSSAPGGLSLVGERGPELVNLPRGSQVFSNADSRAMLGGGNLQVEVVANNNGFGAVVRNHAGQVVAEAMPGMVQGAASVAQGQSARRQSRRVG